MSDTIKGVMTNDGMRKIDYTALANLPTIDSVPTNKSTNAVESGAVYTALATKLDATAQAVDAAKLGGKEPSYYAVASDVQTIADELGLKLDGNIEDTVENLNKITEVLNERFNEHGQALDSAKFGGQEPSYYVTKTEFEGAGELIAKAIGDVQTTANGANSIANDASTKVNTLITDVTEIKLVETLPEEPIATTLYLIPKEKK